eukprot:365261-Chlamydomonas_euryale.AAC.4
MCSRMQSDEGWAFVKQVGGQVHAPTGARCSLSGLIASLARLPRSLTAVRTPARWLRGLSPPLVC